MERGKRLLALAVAWARRARAVLEAEGRGRGGQRRGPRRRRLDLRTHQLESALLGGGLEGVRVKEACRSAWREVVVGEEQCQRKRGMGT